MEIVLSYHPIKEDEKQAICEWVYDGEYSIYNLPSYEEMKEKNMGVNSIDAEDDQVVHRYDAQMLNESTDEEEIKVKCPYCGRKMCEGQIHSFNSGMEWRSKGESMRLNTEKGLSKMIYGDRISACRCEYCKKIIISYE